MNVFNGKRKKQPQQQQTNKDQEILICKIITKTLKLINSFFFISSSILSFPFYSCLFYFLSNLPVRLSVCLFVFVWHSVCLSIYLFIYFSFYFFLAQLYLSESQLFSSSTHSNRISINLFLTQIFHLFLNHSNFYLYSFFQYWLSTISLRYLYNSSL